MRELGQIFPLKEGLGRRKQQAIQDYYYSLVEIRHFLLKLSSWQSVVDQAATRSGCFDEWRLNVWRARSSIPTMETTTEPITKALDPVEQVVVVQEQPPEQPPEAPLPGDAPPAAGGPASADPPDVDGDIPGADALDAAGAAEGGVAVDEGEPPAPAGGMAVDAGEALPACLLCTGIAVCACIRACTR